MAEASLQHSLSQQQNFAPQMRQSLEILQANTLELGQLLHQAMETNPVLEDVTEHESLDEITDLELEDPDNYDDWQETYDDDLRDLSIMERRNQGIGQDTIEAREHFYNSIASPLTLQEHLTKQIRESGLSAEHQGDAKIIVGDLTDHGYLDALSSRILRSTFKSRSNALRMLSPPSKILTPQELALLTYANAFFSSLITWAWEPGLRQNLLMNTSMKLPATTFPSWQKSFTFLSIQSLKPSTIFAR